MVALMILLKLHNPRTPLLDGLKAMDRLGSVSIIEAMAMLMLGLELGCLSTLQALLGASPLMCGVYILPYVMSISLASAGIGILNSKVREVSGIHNPGNGHHDNGIWLSINLEARPDWGKIILFQLIAGIGAGPNVQGPLITLQAALEGRDIAAATTMLGFMRNMFASISLTFGGVVFQNVMRDQHPQLVAELG